MLRVRVRVRVHVRVRRVRRVLRVLRVRVLQSERTTTLAGRWARARRL